MCLLTCAESLAYVTYVDKHQKACTRHHTFYLTICPKLVLTLIEWKIANSTKTNIEILLKENPCLNPKNTFQKLLSEESAKLI